jgi:ribonucleoside-diphosphate reductase alpha chain
MLMKIDYSRDKLLDDMSIRTLSDRYMVGDENSPQEAFARAAKAFADDDDHAQRLYDYASQHWFMFATPVLSNGGTDRGLPISCFLNYVEDSREGITGHYVENAFLSVEESEALGLMFVHLEQGLLKAQNPLVLYLL